MSHTMPPFVPLAETVGVAPGKPKLVADFEAGVATRSPLVIRNAFSTSPLPW